jgi:hypothetical protein
MFFLPVVHVFVWVDTDLQEVGIQLRRNSSGKKRLTRARRPVKQATLRWSYANTLEEFRVHQR